jgi:hypothetical protein
MCDRSTLYILYCAQKMHELTGPRLVYRQFAYICCPPAVSDAVRLALTASATGVDGKLGENGNEKYMMLQRSNTHGG